MKRLWVSLALGLMWLSPTASGATTALIVGGTGKYATLTDEQMATALGGYFADDIRVNIPYPGLPDDFALSIEVGTANLHEAVYATSAPMTIGGVSEGAPVVIAVLRKLMTDPNPPAPDELDAVALGTPSPIWYSFTGARYRTLPETPYNVLVVKAEYDGVADWPDNWLNILAVANAVMGADQLHVEACFYDITQVPERYITTETNTLGGVTTTVLIPTPVLPLLQPLVDDGASPETIAWLDKVLRPIIDSGYGRFWRRTATADTSFAAQGDTVSHDASTDLANQEPEESPAQHTPDAMAPQEIHASTQSRDVEVVDGGSQSDIAEGIPDDEDTDEVAATVSEEVDDQQAPAPAVVDPTEPDHRGAADDDPVSEADDAPSPQGPASADTATDE